MNNNSGKKVVPLCGLSGEFLIFLLMSSCKTWEKFHSFRQQREKWKSDCCFLAWARKVS